MVLGGVDLAPVGLDDLQRPSADGVQRLGVHPPGLRHQRCLDLSHLLWGEVLGQLFSAAAITRAWAVDSSPLASEAWVPASICWHRSLASLVWREDSAGSVLVVVANQSEAEAAPEACGTRALSAAATSVSFSECSREPARSQSRTKLA